MFIPAKHKNIDDYKRLIRTEMTTAFLTVHDEKDFKAERAILRPLTKKLSTLLDINEYYKKYKVPFVRYLFDVEYDKFGAWTAADSIPVYKMASTREENILIKRYKELIADIKPEELKTSVPKDLVMEVSIEDLDIDIESMISSLELIPQGACKLKVRVSPGKSLKFYKTLDYDKLAEVVESLNLKVL